MSKSLAELHREHFDAAVELTISLEALRSPNRTLEEKERAEALQVMININYFAMASISAATGLAQVTIDDVKAEVQRRTAPLKVYTFHFEGKVVGGIAVVVANSEEEARALVTTPYGDAPTLESAVPFAPAMQVYYDNGDY
jgi:hypothetical protein